MPVDPLSMARLALAAPGLLGAALTAAVLLGVHRWLWAIS